MVSSHILIAFVKLHQRVSITFLTYRGFQLLVNLGFIRIFLFVLRFTFSLSIISITALSIISTNTCTWSPIWSLIQISITHFSISSLDISRTKILNLSRRICIQTFSFISWRFFRALFLLFLCIYNVIDFVSFLNIGKDMSCMALMFLHVSCYL